MLRTDGLVMYVMLDGESTTTFKMFPNTTMKGRLLLIISTIPTCKNLLQLSPQMSTGSSLYLPQICRPSALVSTIGIN